MSIVESGLGELEKLRNTPLREQVYSQIKSLILTNRLLPGQQIIIDQLTKQLGVSHTPIREALGMLAGDGLVTMGGYKNLRVTEISASDVREIYEARILFEGWAAAKAATNMSQAKLDELCSLLQCVYDDVAQNRYDRYLESDITLHNAILFSGENSLLLRVAQLVNDQSLRIRSLVEARRPVDIIPGILDEHQSILDAIRARDPSLARWKMEFHLESAMKRTLSVLDSTLEEK